MPWLAPIAVAGQGLIALLMLVLARRLDLAGFEAYTVASALFVLMVSAAPLGTEKLALRVLPPLIDRADAGRVRGYLGWAARRALFGAGACVGFALLWVAWSGGSPATRSAVAVACLAVPAGVAAHLGIELLTAAGQVRFATLVLRLVVPGISLGLVGLLLLAGQPSATGALIAWGFGWAVAAALMLHRLAAVLPASIRTSAPVADTVVWRRDARPLWLYRIAVGGMAQAAILALDGLGAPPATVGAYAAASGVTGLALVLATATNRAYARELALLLDRRDFAGIAALRARRLRWLLPVLAAFLVAALSFAPQILGLFRPEFVAEGVLPLRLLAIAAVVSISFSLAPTYLKYRGRDRVTFAAVAAGAVLQIVLLATLIPAYGAAGAAAAYAAAAVLMYATLALIAQRELKRLRQTPPVRT
jgi:O-antigen/teichoic acid export membrane protein